jgi:serine-type D-Ala-D-Ala carboxypeptidase/endopeptidase (penicillin-binding protein 4)
MDFKSLFATVLVFFATAVFGEDRSDHSIVSIYAVQGDSGKVLIDRNSDLSLLAASCMKIVTTIAALNLLGEDHRFETCLEYDGSIDSDRRLHGNLYIHGGGDPSLGSDRIPGALSWQKQIEVWVDAIQEIGIQKIEGKVVGVATKWEKALAVPSWSWEDLGNYYGAGACGLSFHENGYSLFFKPGKFVGDKASIVSTDPPTPGLIFQNEVKTGSEGSKDNACIYGSEFSPIRVIRGTIPSGVALFPIRGSLPDPAGYVADLLTSHLQKRGITVEQREIEPKKTKVSFHTTYSPSVREIVFWTNQKSINLYAEHLLKEMGTKIYNDGSTSSGIKAVTNFWHSQNVNLEGFHMMDGSGLSRKNLVTTKQLVRMLLKAKKMNFFPFFLESLPQKNAIRAKSGTMSLVKGFAGYFGDVTFAILINNCQNNQKINEIMNDFFSNLDSFDQKK